MEKGATVERGKILETGENGCVVASYDRDGITTPPILPIDKRTYKQGELVYFFLFPDGTGKIICGA